MPVSSQARRRPRPARRRAKPRRSFLSWRTRIVIAVLLIGFAIAGWAVIARLTAPRGNTAQPRFDAIVVLGGFVDADGNLGVATLARTTEGVREYERGVAPRILFSGGLDHGRFVEAAVMARAAQAQGVPASAILLEPQAADTIQNACFTARLLRTHGLNSAEIVTSPSHMPRAAIIFAKTPLQWRMHAAPPLEQSSSLRHAWAESLEVLKTARYLVYANRTESCSP